MHKTDVSENIQRADKNQSMQRTDVRKTYSEQPKPINATDRCKTYSEQMRTNKCNRQT